MATEDTAQTLWIPTRYELENGMDAYFQYMGSYAVLAEPSSPLAVSIHHHKELPTTEEQLMHIARFAVGRAFESMRQLIYWSIPPDARSPLVDGKAKEMYATGSAVVRKTVDMAYAEPDRFRRIEKLGFEALEFYRQPPIVTDPVLWGYLTKSGRRRKITVGRLLGGVMPAPMYGVDFGRKTLADLDISPAATEEEDNGTEESGSDSS